MLAEDVLDVLTSLVDKSLVMMEQTDDAARYRTLETIRDYARERLMQRGEQATTATRHCEHFLTLAKAARQGMEGSEQSAWTRRLEAELDNLRAGVALALEGGVDPMLSVEFEVALMNFWIVRGYATEGRKYVRASLALPAVQASDPAHAQALYVGAVLAHCQGDLAEAARSLEACLTLRRDLGDPGEIAAALSTLSLVRLGMGEALSARAGEVEALALFRQIGDRTGEASGLLHLGQICLHNGDDAQARQHFEACLSLARELKHRELLSVCELRLGEIALEAGEMDVARIRFARSLEACREAGDKCNEATALWWMGKADIAIGEFDLARSHFEAALRAFQNFEMNAEVLGCLEDEAFLAQTCGRAEDAARLYAAAEYQRERRALVRSPRSGRRRQDRVAAARANLGDTAFETAWSEGRAWELEEAVRCALAVAPPRICASAPVPLL